MSDIYAFIRDMPKCELHVHLEGTLEADMKFRLASRNGITLPYADESSMRAAYVFHDLASFLAVYYEGIEVLRTEEDFRDLSYAYLRKAYEQKVLYAEMFFDPQAHTSRAVAFENVITGIHRGQEDAARDFGIQSQLIMCFMRERTAQEAMDTLMQALPYARWLAGVGLDSLELDNPPSKFRAVFERARRAELRVTIHCDVDQRNALEHIRQAMVDLQVDRVDHGVNVLDNAALVAFARSQDLVFTLCPFANRVIRGKGAQQAVRRMLNEGLRVTVNSDDPAYMQGKYITENFLMVQEELSLEPGELIALSRNAFEGAWLPRECIESFLAILGAFALQRTAESGAK